MGNGIEAAMTIEIQPYRDDRIPAVRAFNERLQARGVTYRFPETSQSATLPALPGRSIFREYYLACDGNAVRGGYVFQHQQLALDGVVIPIGNYQFPLSEGIVDHEYASLGARFLRHAVRKQPLLYTLGLGGQTEAITRLLRAGAWRLAEVPFYFKVFHARQFLRNIAPLRTSGARRIFADTLAATGGGSLGLFVFERIVRPVHVRADRSIVCERVGSFGPWADELWDRCLPRYTMMTVRDHATLEALYPLGQPRFIRLRLTRGTSTIGWAVLLDTQMSGNKYFGTMRVGTLVDCLALPEDAETVVLASMRHLRAAGCDIAITNQGHRAWCEALERCGFLAGPSNFLLALSPLLAQRIAPLDQRRDEVHVSRGDGDGPYNL